MQLGHLNTTIAIGIAEAIHQNYKIIILITAPCNHHSEAKYSCGVCSFHHIYVHAHTGIIKEKIFITGNCCLE